MKIEDQGIVLSVYKFGDSSLIVKILSENHGPIKGLVKGVQKNISMLQAGNLIHFSWNARLSDHLGMIVPTLEKAYTLLNFGEYQKILSISSLSSLIDALIPEREYSADIYQKYIDYMENLDSPSWMENYVMLELYILEKCGFGFDLTRCAVSGSNDNISYISPKTGSAVAKDVGEPYKNRLFSIPKFFLEPFETAENLPNSMQEVIDGLEITRYFLAKHFFAESLAKIPSACIQFRNELLRMASLNGEAGQNRDYQLQGSAE